MMERNEKLNQHQHQRAESEVGTWSHLSFQEEDMPVYIKFSMLSVRNMPHEQE
jgi:hypothetical protein